MTSHEQIYSAKKMQKSLERKIERTISLWLIHTYGVVDPAGLRRPELGAAGVERRRWILDLMEKERGGAALRQTIKLVCVWGCPLLIYL